MDEFIKYVNSLPKTLDKKEQEFLFYEYAKTKDPDIREKLISHNLRLSADYAFRYCQKHDIMWKLDEVNTDCIIALIEAIDTFDIDRGAFTTYVYRSMSNKLINTYRKESRDALFNSDGASILYKDNDEVEEGVFAFLYDKTESSFIDEISGDEFVKDILNYIGSWENKRQSEIVKMFCGLDGYKKLDQNQIADCLKMSQPEVSRFVTFGRRQIKKYIVENYSIMYPDYCKGIKWNGAFKSIKERNNYIIKRYFGINCEQYSATQIADELGMSNVTVKFVIFQYRKSLSEEERAKLPKSKKHFKYDEELNKKIFDAYYGLNGYKIHTRKDILNLIGTNLAMATVTSIIERIRDKMIASGEITSEQLKILEENRNFRLEKERMEKYSYLYYSYYGLNGYEKKSLLALSKEFNAGHTTIRKQVNQYEEYLQRQKDKEKGE